LGSYKVTGVLVPFPGKTHLEFEALGSIASLPALDRDAGDWRWLGNFNNYYAGYNYVRLREGVTKEQAETALAEIAKTAYAGLELESRDAGYRFRLQPLNGITPRPMMSQSMGRGMPSQLLWFFSVLGLIVMLLACFNYTNLSIARSLTRAKEVGVRKVMGASRAQVFGQFLSEAVVTALFALLLAYGMLELTIPAFKRLQSLNFFDTTLALDATTAGWFVAFTVGAGLVAGLMPATVLSKFNALTVLQKLENTRLFRRMGLRKTLIASVIKAGLGG
jgi:putative ABC transport system permease protein